MGTRRPTIVKRSAHTVSRKDIDPDALSVLRHLNRSGHKAYLVGGGVRDILLGHKPKDFDISTDAEPPQIKRLFRNCFLVGRRFRLAHIRFGANKVIETSTFRKTPENTGSDTPAPGGMVQWDDNEFGTPEEDARRRDFTINALFYDLSDFSLIDHVGGLSDLHKGLIRSIGDPNVRFREDPVRMIRAVRFAARLGFRIEGATSKAIIRHHADISHASPARLLDEIYKLFSFHSAEASFFLLWDLKLLSAMLPEVDAYVKGSGGADAPLWRYLAALDSGEHWPDKPAPALMLGTVLCDPVMRSLAASRKPDGGDNDAVLIDRFIAPIALRYKIPKAVRFGLVRLLENQIRMDQAAGGPADGKGRRRTSVKRIVHHDSFAESLALLEIRAASGAAEPETLWYWKQAAESDSANPDSHAPAAGTDSGTTPRRRRRRRRKPDHAPSDS
jgi:poly(A) polymerase